MCLVWGVVVLLFTALLPSGNAHAEEVTLSWTNATHDTAGVPLPTDPAEPLALVSTTLYWGVCVEGQPSDPILEATIPTTVPGNPEELAVVITQVGDWCFIAKHMTQNGLLTEASNVAVRSIGASVLPPLNLAVSDPKVYYVVQQKNRFIAFKVGTVPDGTPCDSQQTVNGMYAVPWDDVIWDSNTQPLVVVAECGT